MKHIYIIGILLILLVSGCTSSGNYVSPSTNSYDSDYFVDKDCSDFPTQAAAQRFFRSEGPGDPHHLDGDSDGIACEWNP